MITDFFEKNKGAEFQKNIRQEAYKYSWNRMVEHIEALISKEN